MKNFKNTKKGFAGTLFILVSLALFGTSYSVSKLDNKTEETKTKTVITFVDKNTTKTETSTTKDFNFGEQNYSDSKSVYNYKSGFVYGKMDSEKVVNLNNLQTAKSINDLM